MKYNEKLYFAETFDDFNVSAMDKRYKYSTMESLEEFDRVCSIYEIPYYAMYGTLLGAVRHKGFIPWDDDVDVIMMRKDYELFIRVAQDELQNPFILRNAKNSCYHPLRVQNGTKIRIDQEFLNRFHGCPYPTGIDIYVLDKLPEKQDEREIMKTLFSMVTWASQYSDSLYDRYEEQRTEEKNDDYERVIESLETYFQITIKRDGTESEQLGKLSHKVAGMFHDSNSEYIARVETWYVDGNRGRFHKDLFKDSILMPFEHMMLPVPVGYHEILSHLYGDYFVPVKGGGAHLYGTYKTMENQLLRWFEGKGIEIPQFLKE